MHIPRPVLALLASVSLAALVWLGVQAFAQEPTARGHVVRSADAPTHVIAEGDGQATLLLNSQTGASSSSLSTLVLSPGTEVPLHTHEGSAEVLYIQAGRGEVTIDDQTHAISQGDAVYIPAGAPHSARVTSHLIPLQAVQLYVGPGPEARFRDGEEVRDD